MTIQPTGKKILIEPLTQAEKTKSGIYLPSTESENSDQGRIIAKGPDLTTLNVGDLVLFITYAPQQIKIDDKKYLIAKEEDILAVLID